MKVFFDNNTSPIIADVLGALIKHDGDCAIHIKDAPCGRDASDEEWIAMLALEADEWIVITRDKQLHKNKAQRAAFRRARLFGFVLAPAFRNMPVHEEAALLVRRWPDLRRYASQTARPALVGIQQTSNKLALMPW